MRINSVPVSFGWYFQLLDHCSNWPQKKSLPLAWTPCLLVGLLVELLSPCKWNLNNPYGLNACLERVHRHKLLCCCWVSKPVWLKFELPVTNACVQRLYKSVTFSDKLNCVMRVNATKKFHVIAEGSHYGLCSGTLSENKKACFAWECTYPRSG